MTLSRIGRISRALVASMAVVLGMSACGGYTVGFMWVLGTQYNQISGFSVNLSATSPLGLIASSPQNLVNELSTMFMHGQMPSNMQTEIVSHISTLTDMGERVLVAVYLVITSSQYKIEH